MADTEALLLPSGGEGICLPRATRLWRPDHIRKRLSNFAFTVHEARQATEHLKLKERWMMGRVLHFREVTPHDRACVRLMRRCRATARAKVLYEQRTNVRAVHV